MKGKALIRKLDRRAVEPKKHTPAEARRGRPTEPTVCERCGAVFAHRVWRRPGKAGIDAKSLAQAKWDTCPACRQQSAEEYVGRVMIRGEWTADEAALRRRIRNVAARAEISQPERRIVSISRDGEALEVLTTSQKLAHRIVHELKKAFGGRAQYRWSDDGMLQATWRPAAKA